MGRAGRPRVLAAPPCPRCETEAHVTAHGLKDVDGVPSRSFRCASCTQVFVPGVDLDAASAELREAIRLVRAETDVPYRLLAQAVTRHLGIAVSHATVATWCQADAPDDPATPCEYLSVLWALQREIQAEGRLDHD